MARRPSHFLSQERFPALWHLFQLALLNINQPRGFLARCIGGSTRIVDVGCATGKRIPSLLEAAPGASYLGLDIDENAIAFAMRANPACEFVGFKSIASLRNHIRFEAKKPDTTLILWDVVHHLSDFELDSLIADCVGVTKVVVIDPIQVRDHQHFIAKLIYGLERGEFRRPLEELENRLEQADFRIQDREVVPIVPRIIPWMKVGYSVRILLAPEP